MEEIQTWVVVSCLWLTAITVGSIWFEITVRLKLRKVNKRIEELEKKRIKDLERRAAEH